MQENVQFVFMDILATIYFQEFLFSIKSKNKSMAKKSLQYWRILH